MHSLNGIQVDNVSFLTEGFLERTRVLCLFNIGETPFTAAQREGIETAWATGALVILGIHSATDACYGWEGYGRMLGARFDGHPWTQPFSATTDSEDRITASLGGSWQWRDEVYLFRDLRPEARVLVSLGEEQLDMSAPDARRPQCGFPLAWSLAPAAGGRSFYSSLGHFPEAWVRPDHLRYLHRALEWLLGEK